MLINWVVKLLQVKGKLKGFLNKIHYLVDVSRASHYYTKIVVLTDNARNIIKAVEDRQADRKAKGLRGGGIINYASEFILTIPRDIKQPNTREWQKILHIIYKAIAEVTGLPLATIREHAYAVLHDESASPDKNSHVHFLLGNVINKQFQKKITQKATLHAIKMALNDGIRATVREDNYKYVPKRKQKRNKPVWVIRAEKLAQAEQRFNHLKSLYDDLVISIKNWASHYLLSIIPTAKKQSQSVAQQLDEISNLSTIIENEVTPLVDEIEHLQPDMPSSTKVSPKRKRRRRRK